MKDEFEELTAELARMRPSQPGQRLKQRIAANLAGKRRVVPVQFAGDGGAWFKWAQLAAAAAVLVLAVVIVARHPAVERLAGNPPAAVHGSGSRYGSGTTDEPNLDLVRNANYLIEAEDQGFVEAPTPVPLRKVTWQFVSAAEFRDKRDNTVVQVFVPREETVLIPVAVH